jgi:transposase-like protein
MEANEQLKQLLKEHVKQQKTTGGISNLLQDIFKEAVQEMLKAEMDNHLGYEKHSSKPPNSPTTAMAKPVRRYAVN